MKRIFAFFVILAVLCACTQKKLSDRDRELQDRQQDIDIKKSELSPLAGVYYGTLTAAESFSQDVKLVLEVKDLPEGQGQTDPVLVPKLVGSLRFLYSSEEDGEYIDAPIRTAEFVKASQQLSLVVTHDQFKEMTLTGAADGLQVVGTWSAATMGVSGQIQVSKNNAPKNEKKSPILPEEDK